jgi:Glycosyl transferases group 1
MRLFQEIFVRPAYEVHLDKLCSRHPTFAERQQALLYDGYNSVHLLQPVITGAPDAFLSSYLDSKLLRAWATENGLRADTPRDDILLAQVEQARAEVFYSHTPHLLGPQFLRRLPGCVRKRVCWQAPPAPPGDLKGYDLVLNNFPRSLELYATQGVRTAYFWPSFSPAMADCCDNEERPIDIAFVGGYTRHHRQRAVVLETVAELGTTYNVHFALAPGRLTRLAETPFGWFPPLSKHARPKSIRAVSGPGVFGRSMFELLSKAKIVFNGAVDSAQGDRGNMRCFEAMGCGALLLTDPGRYPEGMVDGETMCVYRDVDDLVRIIRELLSEPERRRRIAANGLRLLRETYSKAAQWDLFQRQIV